MWPKIEYVLHIQHIFTSTNLNLLEVRIIYNLYYSVSTVSKWCWTIKSMLDKLMPKTIKQVKLEADVSVLGGDHALLLFRLRQTWIFLPTICYFWTFFKYVSLYVQSKLSTLVYWMWNMNFGYIKIYRFYPEYNPDQNLNWKCMYFYISKNLRLKKLVSDTKLLDYWQTHTLTN